MPCAKPPCRCAEPGFVSLQLANGLTLTYCRTCWHDQVRSGTQQALEAIQPAAHTHAGAWMIQSHRARYVAFCLGHAIYPPPLEAS